MVTVCVSVHQLTVRAEDNRGRSNLASVRVIIVRVTDSPPQFVDTPYRTSVDVNRAINSTVYRVRAIDPDGLVSGLWALQCCFDFFLRLFNASVPK